MFNVYIGIYTRFKHSATEFHNQTNNLSIFNIYRNKWFIFYFYWRVDPLIENAARRHGIILVFITEIMS